MKVSRNWDTFIQKINKKEFKNEEIYFNSNYCVSDINGDGSRNQYIVYKKAVCGTLFIELLQCWSYYNNKINAPS